MKKHYSSEQATLYHGDCIETMRSLPDASIDSIVTDPPYGIRFMGAAWDGADIVDRHAHGKKVTPNPSEVSGPNGGYRSAASEAGRNDRAPSANAAFQDWCTEWATEALRVLKPGGHMLVSGSPRTWHRLTSGIEDAGFEIRDSIAWLFGSGFPKSLDVAKSITASELGYGGNASGLRKAALGDSYVPSGRNGNKDGPGRRDTGAHGTNLHPTELAQEWEGWGTALKPAFEPIVVARKPLDGTVAQNVLEHGTGALNIAATRVGDGSESRSRSRVNETSQERRFNTVGGTSLAAMSRTRGGSASGRWPTNVLLDESQAQALDEQAGIRTSGKMYAGQQKKGKSAGILGEFKPQKERNDTYGDSGGASRFFPVFRYEAKAPTSERPSIGDLQHPTVKPLDLMRWLVRLVTPPNGFVLDPFAGSGTTLEAACLEGFTAIGIEKEASYLPLILQRIRKPLQQPLFREETA